MTTTIESLRAKLEAAEAVAQAEQQANAQALREKQDDYFRGVLDQYEAVDHQLKDEGEAHLTAAREALENLDLNAAFAGFTKWKASRIIRADVRNVANSAQQRLETNHTIPELRDVGQTFTEWLHLETSGLRRPEVAIAAGIAETLIGEYPTSNDQ